MLADLYRRLAEREPPVYRFSRLGVPFSITPDTSSDDVIVFREAGDSVENVVDVLVWVAISLGVFLVVGSLLGSGSGVVHWPMFAGGFALFALSHLFVVMGRDHRNIERLLIHSPTETSCRIVLQNRRSGQASAKPSVDVLNASLTIHPVKLVILRWRLGRPSVHWTGFALAMHLGSDRFILACQADRDGVDRYIQSLPSQMESFDITEGPVIESDANKALF